MTSLCYYRNNLPGNYEKIQRLKPFDLQQTICKGPVKSASLFINELNGEVELLGCTSVIDLLNMRANGEDSVVENEIEQGSRQICSEHFVSLITNWEKSDVRSRNNRQSRVTSETRIVKCPLTHQKPVNAEIRRVVNKEMTLNYLQREGIFLPPGSVVCKNHQAAMKSKIEKFQSKAGDMDWEPINLAEDLPDDGSNNIEDATVDASDITDSTDSIKTERMKRNFPTEAVDAVVQLVRSLGGDRILTNGEWNRLAEGTKRKKAYLVKKIFAAVCEIISPDGKDDIYQRATSQPTANRDSDLALRLFDNIDERFAAATSTEERIKVLSMVTDLGLTMREVIEGAYKCCGLISSFYHLSCPDMIICGYYFSESQAGKAACDRACAHCKRKMHEWLDSENDIVNAGNIFSALTVENEVVKGMSVYNCTFNDATTKFTNVMPGIQQFFSFDFEDEGVRTRNQFGIGEGKIVKKEKLPQFECTLNVVEEGGHTGDSFWSSLDANDKEETSAAVEPTKEEASDHSEMLNCSTIGCLKSFRSTRELVNHEIRGKHKFTVKKISMTDHAITLFNDLIETRETARIAVSEHVEVVKDRTPGDARTMGWALKASNPSYSLDPTAKLHAETYFNEQRSLVPPRRAEAPYMRKKLEDAKDPSDKAGKRYLLDYWKVPTEKQLQALFTRLETSRLSGPKAGKSKAAKVMKVTKGVAKPAKKGTRSKSSVRTTSGTSRKRRIVKESEDSEEDVIDEREEEEEEEEDQEYLKIHEDDFIRLALEDEINEIFA